MAFALTFAETFAQSFAATFGATPRHRRGYCAIASLLALCAPLTMATSALAMGASAPFTPPARAAAVLASSDSATAATSAALASLLATPGLAKLATTEASGMNGIQLGARPRALIDGEWVGLGETVRGARLQALRADEAELLHPDGRLEHLRLTPLVEWQPKTKTQPPPAASRGGAPRPARLSESP